MPVFGPNKVSHHYESSYHGRNARRGYKTKWVITAYEEYEVFNSADEHAFGHCVLLSSSHGVDYCWMNDDFSGLYGFKSITEDGKIRLALLGENGERFGFFPKIVNITDNWHGYPVSSEKIGNNLLKYWLDLNLISPIDYQRALRRKL